MGTCRSDAKGEEIQVADPQGSEYRCGAQGRSNSRSSDEGSVMELELRDCVVLLLHKNNPKGEDSVGKSKVVLKRLNDRSRMSREVHVRFWESLRGKFLWATHLEGSSVMGSPIPMCAALMIRFSF